MEAQALWRNFPGEIASDLSQYHRLRIADWHQGRMPSYELMELCEYMPDAGRFKTALRHLFPGHPWLFLLPWSQEAEALYQTANETSLLRAAKIPAESLKSEDIGSTIFVSPTRLLEFAEQEEEREEAREGIYAIADRSKQDEG